MAGNHKYPPLPFYNIFLLKELSTTVVSRVSADLIKLQRSPRDFARWQKAQQQLIGERYSLAVSSYRELVSRFPGVEQLWFELGIASAGELDFKLAQEAFARATQLGAKDAALLVLIGQQYHRLRRTDQARACFEGAVKADPSSAHARLSLAAWYERERRLDDAWVSAEACLAQHPQNQQVLCVKALLLHRKNLNSEAEVLLRDIIKRDAPDANVRVSSRHLLGLVLDQLGQFAEAIRWLCESKSVLRQTANVAKMERDYDQADRNRRALLGSLTTETLRRWREQAVPPKLSSQLVLLGGHPRSGTTLLEQILGAHPAIVAIDESEAFAQEIWHPLAPVQPGRTLGLQEANNLPTPQLTRMRERYLKSLLRETDADLSGRVLVDKNPSPTAALHLGLRVFPEMKTIIALRDPRDVVISCFFQNLMLTPANSNFLSLDRTAKHYSDLMDVWLRLRDLGGFSWIESRYEDLVKDPEAEGRRVTEFCGLSWHDNQRNHQEAVRKKILFAPTFSDVAQPVHQRAVGRWGKYAEALAPLQSRLAPYCTALGYAGS